MENQAGNWKESLVLQRSHSSKRGRNESPLPFHACYLAMHRRQETKYPWKEEGIYLKTPSQYKFTHNEGGVILRRKKRQEEGRKKEKERGREGWRRRDQNGPNKKITTVPNAGWGSEKWVHSCILGENGRWNNQSGKQFGEFL